MTLSHLTQEDEITLTKGIQHLSVEGLHILRSLCSVSNVNSLGYVFPLFVQSHFHCL